eukprot:891737-Rhodomonas_salina.1
MRCPALTRTAPVQETEVWGTIGGVTAACDAFGICGYPEQLAYIEFEVCSPILSRWELWESIHARLWEKTLIHSRNRVAVCHFDDTP